MQSDLVILIIAVLFLAVLLGIVTIRLIVSTREFRKEIYDWEYMLGNIPDVLIKIDQSGNIQYMNPAGVLVFKEVPSDYTGRNLEDIFISEGFSGIAQDTVLSFISQRKATIIESSISDKNSKNRFLEIRLIPGPANSKAVPHFLCLIRDITQRKLSESNLLEAKLKAQESERLKSAFLANMSHEIRTPLNAIVGFTQIILEENLSNEEKSKYFEYIYQNSNQLINLINDIIDLSKLESQQLPVRENTFNLNEQLEEIREVIENEKKHRDKGHLILLIEKEFDDPKADIITDPYRLRQILLNLLVNAIKFTPKGFIQFGYRQINRSQLLF